MIGVSEARDALHVDDRRAVNTHKPVRCQALLHAETVRSKDDLPATCSET